jgi:hypothetical protein
LAIAAAKAEPAVMPVACSTGAAAGVPWEVVQTEMKVEGRVILAGVVGVLGRHAQIEMRRQVAEYAREFGGHALVTAQTEMEGAR